MPYSYFWTGNDDGVSLGDAQNWLGGPVDEQTGQQLTSPADDPANVVSFQVDTGVLTGSLSIWTANVLSGHATLAGTISSSHGLTVSDGASLTLQATATFSTASVELAAGSVVQQGGSNTATLGVSVGRSYNLMGGSLGVANGYLSVGSKGVFLQQGGTATASGVVVSPTGSYTLSAGTLTATSRFSFIDGVNGFDQTGGTARFSGLVAGYDDASTTGPTCAYQGGSLTTGDLYVGDGGWGTFNETATVAPLAATAGAVFVGFVNSPSGTGATANAKLRLSGTGALAAMTATSMALAAFDSIAPADTASSGTVVMSGTSSLTLTGGDAHGVSLIVGDNGTGTFEQFGAGQITVADNIIIGNQGAGTASVMSLSGTGALNVQSGARMQIGFAAGVTGTFFFNTDGPTIDDAQFNSRGDDEVDVGVVGTGVFEMGANLFFTSFFRIGQQAATGVSTATVDSHGVTSGAHQARLQTLLIAVGNWTDARPAGDGKLIVKNGADVSANTVTLASAVTGFGVQASAAGGIVMTSGASFEINAKPSTAAADTMDIAAGGSLVGHGLIDSTKLGVVNGTPVWSLKVVVDAGGTLAADSGSLVVHGNVSGAGAITLASGSTLELDGLVAGGTSNPTFDGANATLRLAQSYGITVGKFGTAAGQAIDLLGVPFAANDIVFQGDVYGGEVINIESPDGSTILGSVSLQGSGLALPVISSDGQTGTVIQAARLVAGSTATLRSDTVYGGSFALGDGTVALNGHTLTLTGSVALTGGTIVGPGTLKVLGSGSLGHVGIGTSGGAAFVTGGGGTLTIGPGTSLGSASWTIAKVGTTIALGESLTFGGSFSQTNATTLNLATNTLTLSGPATFTPGPAGAPVIKGTGKLVAGGAETLAGLTIGGAVLFRDNGSVTQTGAVTLGDATGGAAQITVAAGAQWQIAGDVGIAAGNAATIINLGGGRLLKSAGAATRSVVAPDIENLSSTTGVIRVATGKLELAGRLSGHLALKGNTGTTLLIDKSAGAGVAVDFVQPNATVQFNDAPHFLGTINGFGASESLDLRSIADGGGITPVLSYAGGAASGTLTVSDGSHIAHLAMVGSYAQAEFHLASDAHGGSLVTYG